jgi:hypothetical protein
MVVLVSVGSDGDVGAEGSGSELAATATPPSTSVTDATEQPSGEEPTAVPEDPATSTPVGGVGGGDADATSEPGPIDVIPTATLSPGEPGQVCAAAVERLRIYRKVAAVNGPELARDLFDLLTEFSDQIPTYALGEEWGDYLVEQLTGVRRALAEARTAFASGDTSLAVARNDFAVSRLDVALAGVDCS